MALRKLPLAVAAFTIFIILCHGIEAEDKNNKKTVAAEKDKLRSAGREKGSFQKLAATFAKNRTEDRKSNRRRGKENINKLLQINRNHKMNVNHMMNDNEGAIAINQKTIADNDTNTLAEKMKALRREGPTYEAVYKYSYVPQVMGVFCDFENDSHETSVATCNWEWNSTVSSYDLGFKVLTPVDILMMNTSSPHGFRFNGPATDADGKVDGHFLYLPLDPTMGNMVVKSPIFPGLWEFCKIEATLHQSEMQNANIRLLSETELTGVQLVLQEFLGNNAETWQSFRFMIGKVHQEVRIMIEVTRPSWINLTEPLPHIAIDNIRMIECFPEPPVYNGECQQGQLKCNIMGKESCIKLQQVCDLVKDCDDSMDEHQSCEKMPFGSYCNFEYDTCGFEFVPQTILKWSRHHGPTPTAKTGPNFDHTCGPYDMGPTKMIAPPLVPAHMNFNSLSQCVGYYLFVNMNATNPNKERANFASTAMMHTVIFNPPPKVHGNITSKYYNCCMIRFYYQQNGKNYGSLSVDVVELTSRGNITTSLWFSTKDKGENWYRAAIFLPNITRRYYIMFKTRMGMRIYSDSAIDDFSMAPECFGLNIDPAELGDYNYYDPVFEEQITPHQAFADKIYYRFTTCGAVGRFGPNQTMCDVAYNNTPVQVHVIQTPPYQGIQMWEVPEEGYYTIIAMGASGGLGSAWAGVTHGFQTAALFELHKSEVIYMLVGQQGLNACKKTLSAQENQECSKREITDSLQTFTSKTHEVRNTEIQDGGGGGGGATYVFLMDKDNQAYPLLVAAGGGGISVGVFKDDNSQHGHGRTNDTPESGYMYGNPGQTSGAGGGWLPRSGPTTPGHELVRGASLKEGGFGGLACSGIAHGGFGGGGGGCRGGGGGGGWLGGNTNQDEHGGGGYSYVDPVRSVKEFTQVSVAQHMGPGEALIIPAIHDCGCDYRCVALNEYRSEVKCYCPYAWSTDSLDGTKCIREDEWPKISWFLVIVLSVIAFICALVILCVCLYLYNTYQRKKEAEIRRKRLLEQEVELRRLRNPPGGNENTLLSFNPHYGCEGFLPQGIDVRGLPQVSRESLKLVKALGQGAFGEVYQGLYRHRTGDSIEMPVAVKTLPELSTGQSESDFLMEAAIMAKFNHPNIVHLIGVCFDRHPRFIVLELLAGGDLKNFLRESRPKPERASALTMKDLLLCAHDICKGCKYLEAKRFIHRDIAARNCLLTSRGPGRVVKIADFGMARDVYRSDYYKKGGKAMLPIKWMPPEAYIDGVFTIKTDVWSFGVLMWEVFSLGVMPYTGCANREVMDMVSGGGRLEKPYGCPQEIYRLMCECWNPTPSARPSFSQMFERLTLFLQKSERYRTAIALRFLHVTMQVCSRAFEAINQDPEIVGASLPVMRSFLAPVEGKYNANGPKRAVTCDYLVPMSPGHDADRARANSTTDASAPGRHSKSPTAARRSPDKQDLQYQHLLKASQDYGNIQTGASATDVAGLAGAGAGAAAEPRGVEAVSLSCVGDAKRTTQFLPSNSTDRLLSAVEGAMADESDSEIDVKPVVWETSFTEKPVSPPAPAPPAVKDTGPTVEKLISITPTSPKPPENVLSKAMDTKVIDKTNNNNKLSLEKKMAPIASPDPPRISAWPKEEPKVAAKPKPLCLNAAQLEQNLNALKKNSGSVNLTTMNIVPPYINVVTSNKTKNPDTKTIQIDPKKAVIHDLQSPKENEQKPENKLKQSDSAASLLNGPMTDVPYADSDNTSSSSGSNGPNHIQNIQKSKQNNYSEVKITKNDVRNKITKQGSNGGTVNDSEINC